MFKSIACGVSILSLLTASIASAETVTARSGNGGGSIDAFVSFLVGAYSSDFSQPLPATDFSNAQTGPPAFVISPNAFWIPRLISDPAARWIGTNATAGVAQGNTALYSQSFQIHSTLTSATLTLHYAVDDHMGGVYLNGTPVCANLITNDLNNFTQEHTFTCNDVGPSLHVGTNWLYIDAGNGGGAAGLLFSAAITTTEGAILPHIAAGDVWTTGFFVVNTGSQAAQFTIQFFDSSGNSLLFPLSGGPTSTLVDSVPGQGMNYYEASAPGSALLVGWGLFTADSSVAVQAVFRKRTADNQYAEAAVPASPGTLEFVVPFDASTLTGTTDPLYTAIAIANLDPSNTANVACIARDQSGVTIPNAVSVPALNPRGHWSGYLFPALTGKRGTFDCTANTAISALAFRFIGTTTSIFSSLPVLNINSAAVIPPILNQPNPQPSVASLSPSSATAGTPSLALIVNGSGFIASSTVTFNGVSHAAAFVNSGQLTIALNAVDLATASTFPVVVANPSPGGGVSNAVSLTVVPAPPTGLTGVWAGAWGSIPVPSAYGALSANLTQTGTSVTGTVTLFSSFCFAGGALSGTVSGNSFSAVIALTGINISGTVDSTGNKITGAYIVSSGVCAGDYGVITLTRQ